MKTKLKFLQAVQILAPNDQFILQVQRIPEEKLPEFPGGAALKFVAAFEKLWESIKVPVKSNAHQKPAPPSLNGQVSISHALRVKSAEY